MQKTTLAVTEECQLCEISGRVRLSPNTAIFYAIGPNPRLIPGRSKILPAGTIFQIDVPAGQNLAFCQVTMPGSLNLTQIAA